MVIRPIKTKKVTPGSCQLLDLLDTYVSDMKDGDILAITSKIVALCAGDVVPKAQISKEQLVRQQADRYVLLPDNQYGVVFTVIGDTLIPNAGVDESNASGVFVLWPRDPQGVANSVRHYLRQRFAVERVGVIITDSTARPLRWGMGGICIAHSGFKALRDYRGTPDLYGNIFRFETSDIAGGLASAAVLEMGEGAEQTPLALIGGLPFVEFQDEDPTPEEKAALRITLEDDLYAPLLAHAPWQPGGQAWRRLQGGAAGH